MKHLPYSIFNNTNIYLSLYFVNSYHSLRSLLQLGSIYHEVSNSPLGNFSQYYADVSTRSKLWIQQCGFPAAWTPQLTLLHILPVVPPKPGNVLYLTHNQITNLNRIF